MLFLQANPVSAALNSADWVFPTCEIFHIVGFGISIGTIAVVDFSLLGLGLQRKSIPQLLRELAPWTLTALVVVLIAGVVLFLTMPLDYYRNNFAGALTLLGAMRKCGVDRFVFSSTCAVYGTPEKRWAGTTHLKNLFICGTDQGFVGIIGSMFSGIAMANRHLLGIPHKSDAASAAAARRKTDH